MWGRFRTQLKGWIADPDIVAIALVTVGFFVWGHQGWPWMLDLLGMEPRGAGAWMTAFAIGAFVMAGLPALVLRLGHRASLADYGLGAGDVRKGVLFGLGIAVIGSLVMFFFTSQDDAIRGEYPLHGEGMLATGELVAYEASYLGFFVGGELGMRGILLFAIARKSGSAALAVLVCTALQIVWHTGKPLPELLVAPLWGLLIGVMSLRLRSAWYALFAHWLTNVALDLGILFR